MTTDSRNVFRILYKSVAVSSLTQKDVADIVAHSNKNNNAKGISGFLVFENGRFMQLLEGDEAIVKDLYYSKIAKDSRHSDVIVLKESHGPRTCSDWTMSQLPIGMFESKFVAKSKKIG
jgi:hypothetical protein